MTSFTARTAKSFEIQFQKLARNPHLLALAAQSMNTTSTLRIELAKIRTELSSLKARRR